MHIWCIKNVEKNKSKPPSISLTVTPKEASIISQILERKISFEKSFSTKEEKYFNQKAENKYQIIQENRFINM